MRRRALLGGAKGTLLSVLCFGCAADAANTDNVPTFEVDPFWPDQLEYPFILGAVTGLTVAPDGNVLAVMRLDRFANNTEASLRQDPPGGECCMPAGPVIEFDPDGNMVRQWGGPDQGHPWFERPHGIAVDPEGNVWIGGSGADDTPDTHIAKFTRDGTFIETIGEVGATPSSMSTTSFGGVARIAFDEGANEAYVADGFYNGRVVVLDITTGEFKRTWGAYGNEPDDADLGEYDPAAPPAQQFRSVTCAEPSNDGLVYVCDRGNNRLQVFETDGTFVEEVLIHPDTHGEEDEDLTPGRGSVWDLAFSPDAGQQYIYVADGMNERIYIVERETLAVLTSFGTGGRYPSHFQAVGSVAVDAQGNVYTGEDEEGKRIQKFVNTGTGPVTAEHQGPVWPANP